jgi:hypothetical protein
MACSGRTSDRCITTTVRDNQLVPWRRLLLFAALLLVAISLVSAMTPSEQRFRDSPGANAEPPPASRPASVVEASLPAERTVRARIGDVVRLSVRAPSADVVEVTSLAVEEPVDAGATAQLEFVADRAGSFPVRLREAGEAIGTLRVAD